MARPHGVRGLLRIHLHNPASEAVTSGALSLVSAGGRVRGLRLVAWSGPAPIFSAPGVDDRDDAEALRGARLLAPRDAIPVASDEYLYEDLAGCIVIGDDAPLGRVAEVFSAGAADVLVIRGDDGRELMVPLVDDWVASVDVAARRIVLRDAAAWLD